MAEEFVGHVVGWMSRFYPEGPKRSSMFGRMVNRAAYRRVMGYVDASRDRVRQGGDGCEDDLYIDPTVLLFREGLEDFASAAVMQEEVFGPLIPICTYSTLNDAIAFVNNRPKPLALYCFTASTRVADRVIDATSSGAVMINDVVGYASNPALPFGGVGESGMGNYHGRRSFVAFSHEKAIVRQSASVDIPMRYPPYNAVKVSVAKRILAQSPIDVGWLWGHLHGLASKRTFLIAGLAAYIVRSKL